MMNATMYKFEQFITYKICVVCQYVVCSFFPSSLIQKLQNYRRYQYTASFPFPTAFQNSTESTKLLNISIGGKIVQEL